MVIAFVEMLRGGRRLQHSDANAYGGFGLVVIVLHEQRHVRDVNGGSSPPNRWHR